MNPLWAFLFKARFNTPLSIYRMSLAEIVVLLSIVLGAGYGVAKGVMWIVGLEGIAPGT